MPRRGSVVARRKGQPAASTRDKVTAIVAFVVIVAAVYAVSWYLQRPAVKQFPPDISVKVADFMLCTPKEVVHFRIVNLTETRTRTAGSELLKNGTLISLAAPRINVTANDVNWTVDIEIQEGVTVNILGMPPDKLTRLVRILNGSTLTTELLEGVLAYRVLTTNGTWGKLAIAGGFIVYSDQSPDPTPSVRRVLTTITTGESRLFDDEDIRKAFYLAAQGGPFLGLSFTEFYPGGAIGADVDWMFSFARYTGQRIEKDDVFKLTSQQDAIDKYDKVKPLYFVKSQSSYIIGPFIVAQYDYPLEDLRTVVLSL